MSFVFISLRFNPVAPLWLVTPIVSDRSVLWVLSVFLEPHRGYPSAVSLALGQSCWALQEPGCSGDINITAGSTEGVALNGCFEPRPVGSEMSVVLGFERPCVSPEAP